MGVKETPIVWIIAVYFISSVFQRWLVAAPRPGKKQRGVVKKFLWGALWGIGAVLIADQLSPEEPVWLALTFILLVGGALFSFFYLRGRNGKPVLSSGMIGPDGEIQKQQIFHSGAESGLIGLGVYFGGLFYLEPLLAGVTLALTLEIFFIGKDILTGVMVFIGLIPILFQYTQMNPYFFWMALGTELLFILYFRCDLWKRVTKPFPDVSRNGNENPS